MPKRTDKPRSKPRWRVDLMHGRRAEHLGVVEADTEAEALAEACREWRIKADWQKRRVVVRRVPD
jgi:hypothetical protein